MLWYVLCVNLLKEYYVILNNERLCVSPLYNELYFFLYVPIYI